MSTLPFKLKLARKALGISQSELAARLGITKQAVSKYERGITRVDSTRLVQFADALERPVDFFFSKPRLDLENLSFRKRSKLTGTCLNKVKADVSSTVEHVLAIEDSLHLPERYVAPDFGEGFVIEGVDEDVDDAAHRLRELWELGSAPIADVSGLLISRGIRLVEVNVDEDFDGLSTMVDGVIPVIVINVTRLKMTGETDFVRRRMTLLHELAHLILPLSASVTPRKEEKICTRFGAAFLIPPAQLIQELGHSRSRLALSELKALRKRYGISVAALVYQAGDHGIMQQYLVDEFWRKRRLNPVLMSEYKFGGGELEASGDKYFDRLLARAVAEGAMSESKAVAISGYSLEEVRQLSTAIPGLGPADA